MQKRDRLKWRRSRTSTLCAAVLIELADSQPLDLRGTSREARVHRGSRGEQLFTNRALKPGPQTSLCASTTRRALLKPYRQVAPHTSYTRMPGRGSQTSVCLLACLFLCFKLQVFSVYSKGISAFEFTRQRFGAWKS